MIILEAKQRKRLRKKVKMHYCKLAPGGTLVIDIEQNTIWMKANENNSSTIFAGLEKT